MSNIERAADVIDQWTQEGYELNSAVGSPHAIAERLADAGLLAPDVPEPGVFKDGSEVEWDTPDGYVNVENGLITISHDERTEDDTPEQRERLRVDEGQIIITDPAEAEYLGHLIIAAARTIKGEPK